jgi:hypothetical protein
MTAPQATVATPLRPRRPALLLPEAETRCYQPAVAQALGSDDDALVLQQLHYRLRTSTRIAEGCAWYKASYADWQADNFPNWSVASLQRSLTRLENAGIVESQRLARHPRDRTKYYTINYEALWRTILTARLAWPPTPGALMDTSILGPSIVANCHDVSEEREREKQEPAADVPLPEAEKPAPSSPPRRQRPPVIPVATKVVQYTKECSQDSLKAAKHEREEHERRFAVVDALAPALSHPLEARAREKIGAGFIPLPHLKLVMYDLYQEQLLAEEGQPAGKEQCHGETV